mgnify:FL=1
MKNYYLKYMLPLNQFISFTKNVENIKFPFTLVNWFLS